MKNIILVFLLACGMTASNAQIKESTKAEKILQDLYSDKEKSSNAPQVAKSTSSVENNEIFKEWLLASFEEWLMMLTLENNSSFRRSKGVQYLPGLKVENSIFSITPLLDDMDVEIKKDKVKATFIVTNYLSGKRKRIQLYENRQ